MINNRFMRRGRLIFFFITATVFGTTRCRKPYEPPAIKASNHFLAIDGVINTGTFTSSIFKITRSVSLVDTLPYIPELHAQVFIKSGNGNLFPLSDTGSNGIYVSAIINLDKTQQYQLSVTTTDGNNYISDFVTPKNSPPIDSITWQLVNDPVSESPVVDIYMNAHDPTNSTRYYRWDYTETWQYQAIYQTYWGVNNGMVYPLGQDNSFFNCWTSAPSTSILLGSTVTLSDDIIIHAPIAKFLKNDPRMDVKYSILVRQYPLDPASYRYWLTVQQNSQSLGGLYDLQPSQIKGNIHGVTNPNDPVIGYVSASSIQEQRIFINNYQLPGWKSNPAKDCPMDTVKVDPLNTLIYSYPDPEFTIYQFISGAGNPPSMVVTKKPCLDCRSQGGSIVKPPFWQ
jgi:hypothetical protein